MFKLCHKEGHLDIIIDNLRKINVVSKEWTMTVQEKRNLFKECASVLEASNDSIGAYNSMVSYLRLFEGSPESELVENNVGASAKRCVILAVKVPTAINFEEVLELNAIKSLRGVRF